jgi:hypothetical protein
MQPTLQLSPLSANDDGGPPPLRDYYEWNSLRQRIDGMRAAWAGIPPEYLPPGFDLEPALKYILSKVLAPVVFYRADEVEWYRDIRGREVPCLPEHSPHRQEPVFRLLYPTGPGGDTLRLGGLFVAGPVGKRATWKVACNFYYTSYVLRRFGLDEGRAHETILSISRTSDGKIRRYPTAEAAKDAVVEALLKIGLVGPIVDVDEMHTVTDYDA